jgi:hypothetical protein
LPQPCCDRTTPALNEPPSIPPTGSPKLISLFPFLQIEFPSILLPPNISSGSIVDITVSRNFTSEQKTQASFLALQDSIYHSFGEAEPAPPVLRCRNATQTSVVLEWDPIQHATADVISLSLFRNNQKAGNIPRPTVMQSTKISGLAVDTEYTFHLVLRTSAGTFSSERVTVRTHKMTDLSGITVTPGILPAALKENLTKAIGRIGAKTADTVRIDTTHFVTVEGRGLAWEKAVEMNIPVVRPEWVEACERGGRIVGVRQYYLDADPRQRQVIPPQAEPEPARNSLAPTPSQESAANSNGASAANGVNGKQAAPPSPPEKDTPKKEEESSDEEEEEDGEEEEEEAEEEKTAVPDEQKVRVEDRDQYKVALRPAAPTAEEKGKGKEKAEEAKEKEDGEDDGDGEEGEAAAGDHTPENSNFQDVAL